MTNATRDHVDSLLAALAGDDDAARREAAEALGEARTVRAVEPLITALRDRDPRVRGTAASALARIGDLRAIEPLIRALADHSEKARQAASEALVALGEAAVRPLILALHDPCRDVREGASATLAAIGAPAAVLLARELDRPSAIMLDALIAMRAAAVEPLIAALRQQPRDWPGHDSAIEVLGRVCTTRGVLMLAGILREGAAAHDVRVRAARCLAKLGDSEWLPRRILAQTALEPEERVRILEALRGIEFVDGHIEICYDLGDLERYCKARLRHEQPAVAQGAGEVLDWLMRNRDRHRLLRPAHGTDVSDAALLVRPADTGEQPQ